MTRAVAHWTIKIVGMSGLLLCLMVIAPGNSMGGVGIEISLDSDHASLVYDEGESPGQDYVRVEASFLGEDMATPAFWRVKYRAGYTWVEGQWQNDVYLPGHWRPNQPRRGNWAWVPGHWVGRTWIVGRWRPATLAGYVWIEGQWNRDGEWVEGYWCPTAHPPRGKVWEPGYWSRSGRWVQGYWRPISRRGYLWVGGEFDERGVWIKGRWIRGGPEERWMRGYWDNQAHWHSGQLVKISNPKERYIPSHYNRHGEWIAPHWADERARQREKERQIRNYREDREGSKPDRQEGGEVRKIGGPQHHGEDEYDRPPRDDYQTRPGPRQEDDRGYRRHEPSDSSQEEDQGYRRHEREEDQEYRQDEPSDREERIEERRKYTDEEEQPKVKADPPFRSGQPGRQEKTKSKSGLHKGWDKGVGNKHGEDEDQNQGKGNQGQEKQKDKDQNPGKGNQGQEKQKDKGKSDSKQDGQGGNYRKIR